MPNTLPLSPLHICFVAHEYHPDFDAPEQLLSAYHSLTDWSEALVAAGCRVSAVVRFKLDNWIQYEGVDYHFVQDRYGPQLKFWQIPRRMHRTVVQIGADVVHAHNFNKILQHRDLLRRLRNISTPLILQNHAETPRFWLRNVLQRQVFSQVGALLFCAPGQEQIWYDRHIIDSNVRLDYVMEGATHFQVKDRKEQRKQTGLSGDPVLLWVGHLNRNKDPLTILRAFTLLLKEYPQAQLYLIYRTAPLLEEVKDFLQQDARLRDAVHLLGSKKHEDLEVYFNSADYFVVGSHREGSGYSAMEAMACGCIPILTAIPSYRMMSDEGRVYPLWEVGNENSLVEAMRKAFSGDWSEQSQSVRQFYEDRLSYPAIAHLMKKNYKAVLEERNNKNI